ncbi:conserved hypothetical protein [Roseibium sp. TrichSKD4]|nr:conserved hypothetical protein [Roseibium sp. TrichSKD4]
MHLRDRLPALQATDRIFLTARGFLKTEQILSGQFPVVGGAKLGKGIAVFGHSLRLASMITLRDKPDLRNRSYC